MIPAMEAGNYTMKTCDSQVNSYSSIVQDDASGPEFVGSSTSQIIES